MDNVLSIHGGHDACFVFRNSKDEISVLEYERFTRRRYSSFSSKFDKKGNVGSNHKERIKFLEYVKDNIKNSITLITYTEQSICTDDKNLLLKYFPNSKFSEFGHHQSHADSGFHLSDYDAAIVFSIDGGGQDDGIETSVNVYEYHSNKCKKLDTIDINLGKHYALIAHCISEIKRGTAMWNSRHSFAYPGKLMGLCAYGNIKEEWIPHLKKYFKDGNLNKLAKQIGLSTHKLNSVSGQSGYDLAATTQYVFEEICFSIISDYFNLSDNFIIVGGCGLNVLFNNELKRKLASLNKNLFIPPNPGDCGLPVGHYLKVTNQKTPNITYNGFDILDINLLDDYVKERSAEKITISGIVDLLKSNKIIGIVQGNSEVGPRALGNRSIICDPTTENMKDILNSKVKFREWYRPFAPVCRIEDSNKYFHCDYQCEFMSYAPLVKENYRNKLKAITHYDSTSRLQTVTKNQHSSFYDILTELSDRNFMPIILNTSFNIRGQPILTRIEDALFVLDNTEMDCVVINNWCFKKPT